MGFFVFSYYFLVVSRSEQHFEFHPPLYGGGLPPRKNIYNELCSRYTAQRCVTTDYIPNQIDGNKSLCCLFAVARLGSSIVTFWRCWVILIIVKMVGVLKKKRKKKKKDLFISFSSISRLSCAFSVVASSYSVCIVPTRETLTANLK